jgi:hypothetical protein
VYVQFRVDKTDPRSKYIKARNVTVIDSARAAVDHSPQRPASATFQNKYMPSGNIAVPFDNKNLATLDVHPFVDISPFSFSYQQSSVPQLQHPLPHAYMQPSETHPHGNQTHAVQHQVSQNQHQHQSTVHQYVQPLLQHYPQPLPQYSHQLAHQHQQEQPGNQHTFASQRLLLPYSNGPNTNLNQHSHHHAYHSTQHVDHGNVQQYGQQSIACVSSLCESSAPATFTLVQLPEHSTSSPEFSPHPSDQFIGSAVPANETLPEILANLRKMLGIGEYRANDEHARALAVSEEKLSTMKLYLSNLMRVDSAQ